MRLIISAIAFAVTLGAILTLQARHDKTVLPVAQLAQVASPWVTAAARTNGKTSQFTADVATERPSPDVAVAPAAPSRGDAKRSAEDNIGTMTTSTSPLVITTPTPSPTSTSMPPPTTTPTATPEPPDTPTPTSSTSPTPTTTTTATPSYFISLVSLTSPIKRGTYAELKIQTSVGAQCSLKYVTPKGTPSSAKDKNTGLALTTAVTTDGSGYIDWLWSVSGGTNPGTANLTIGCGLDKQTYSSALAMEITNQ